MITLDDVGDLQGLRFFLPPRPQLAQRKAQCIHPREILAAIALGHRARRYQLPIHDLDVERQTRRPLNQSPLSRGGFAPNMGRQIRTNRLKQPRFPGPSVKLRQHMRR